MKELDGFSARFNLWVGDKLATRNGCKYYCPYKVSRNKDNHLQWWVNLAPIGTMDFPMAYQFTVLLSNMVIIGNSFLHALLMVRDPMGQPLANAQAVKWWLPNVELSDDYTSSVDEMFFGWPVQKGNDFEVKPVVLISTIYPNWQGT
jgi:hypothetical protein